MIVEFLERRYKKNAFNELLITTCEIVPRIGEKVIINLDEYKVKDVIHDLDNNCIKVYCKEIL